MDYEAKVEAMEQRVAAMESDIKEIKNDVKNMPEQIAQRVNESIDMKIKLAISETEKKYQAKLIGLLLAIIGEGVGLVISFLK
jgi:multidrug resistance efflux pump